MDQLKGPCSSIWLAICNHSFCEFLIDADYYWTNILWGASYSFLQTGELAASNKEMQKEIMLCGN